MVLSADVKRVNGKFVVFARGGRINTGLDAADWVRRCAESGAGEIVLNSIDTDGVKRGFDIEMLRAVASDVKVPVIASGGAGSVGDFIKLFKSTDVDAGLGASVFHYGEIEIRVLKKALKENGIEVRL